MNNWLETLWRDLRQAARSLSRSPGLVAVSALSLGLGIGLNAVLYMGLRTIYWHEPTLREPDRVFAIEPGNANQFSYPDYQDLLGSGILENAAGFRTSTMTLGSGTAAQRANVLVVTANFFEACGIDVALGRAFTASEAAHGREPRVAVVTSGFWKSRLGGDPSAIGDTIVLDGERFEIAGVLPDDYRAITGWMTPPIIVPVSRLTLPSLDSRGTPSLTMVARLRTGSQVPQVREAVTAFVAGLGQAYPDRLPAEGRRASVVPIGALQFRGTPAQFTFLVTITGVVAGLVLLIACVNVTGLLLARATERRRELAVRAALGAGRGRMAQSMLIESLLLVGAGAFVGLPLAYAVNLVPADWLMGPLRDAMTPDARLLPFAVVLVGMATLMCGIGPALRAGRTDLLSEVRQGGEPVTPRARLRQALVAAQVGMSFVLVVAALLCVRSQARVAHADLGFDPHSGIVAAVDLDRRLYPNDARVTLGERLVERIRAIPGVTSVSVADIVPLGGNTLVRSFHPAGRTDIPGTRPETYSAGPGYFQTLGIMLVRGRDFDSADRAGAPAVAIVNETFARTYFPGEDAIGQRVQTVDDPEALIVGLVRDHRIGTTGEAASAVVFYPYAQRPSDLKVHVRTATRPDALVPAVRQAVEEAVSTGPITVQTLRSATSLEFTMRQTGTALMGTMGGVGLLLALIGIYGVLAHAAAARTVEVGIRMALGASGHDIRRELLVRSLATVGPGIALGIIASLVLLPALATFLAGVSPHDPIALSVGVALLLLVGLGAGYLPARRAARVDPMQALRRTA